MKTQQETLCLLTGLFLFLLGMLAGNEITKLAIAHDLNHNGRFMNQAQLWYCTPDFPPTTQ